MSTFKAFPTTPEPSATAQVIPGVRKYTFPTTSEPSVAAQVIPGVRKY
ncbi:unnamed protein product, partial [Didymodactylos carnosus]